MARATAVIRPAPGDRFLTVKHVMERTGYGRHKVYDLLKSGELPSIKDGKYRRVRESTLETFMAAREGAA